MKTVLTLGSLFDGIGGFPYAATLEGITPIWASEIVPEAIAITKKHFPDMMHLGDITALEGGSVPPVDIITFGSPCFPAGTMVLRDGGYVPIEQLKIGDRVLTHKNRWRAVTDIGYTYSPTVKLKGNVDLETTAEHPIYSTTVVRETVRTATGAKTRCQQLDEVKNWTDAADMEGKQWATPHVVEALPVPQGVTSSVKQKALPAMDENFWRFVGHFLCSGWVRNGQRSGRPLGQKQGQIFLCDSFDKEEMLRGIVEPISGNYFLTKEKTCLKIGFCSQVLCEWLALHFGRTSKEKKIPAWVLSLDLSHREALLQGIVDVTGYQANKTTIKVNTVSKAYALGLRLLATNLGYSTSIGYSERAKTTVIEGRLVNQLDTYEIALRKNDKVRPFFCDEYHHWYKCKSVMETGETKQVFNISVEEDESYVADSIVVHNCQDLSVAGKRKGLDGERSGLFLEAIRIINEMREATNGKYPTYAVWENVPGAFSSGETKGADFRAVLEAFTQTEVPLPPDGVWANSGLLILDGSQPVSIGWRLLDAQHWGIPQRRSRIFLVASFGGKCPSEILFVEDGLRGGFA